MWVPCASWIFIALSAQQYGLYSAFMGCFVYFFLGTSRDVTLGPTAIMSLLVSFYTFREPAYAVLLAFLSGCIQLGMGFLRLGKTLRPSCHGDGGLQLCSFWGTKAPPSGDALPSAFLSLHSKGYPCVSVCLCICVCQEGWLSALYCAQSPGHLEKCPGPQSLVSFLLSKPAQTGYATSL